MILNVNKPKGMTSHDVVDRIRGITGERRVGHAGTLDPFATGVLVIGVGKTSTQQLASITKDTQKEYIAVMELGKTSTTGDPEGIITETTPAKQLQSTQEHVVRTALAQYIGTIEQTPPAYSAVKIEGKKAYELARQGRRVELPKRSVQIFELELLECASPFLTIRVVCSAGTYIRSLAQDIGAALGVGAYLTELTRTRVGDFPIEKSKTLEELSRALPNA